VKLSITLSTVEFLFDYVTGITDPLLDVLHRIERDMTDKNQVVALVRLDKAELIRLYEIIQQLIDDDKTMPTELARLASRNKN
jgi:hypothetical protein